MQNAKFSKDIASDLTGNMENRACRLAFLGMKGEKRPGLGSRTGEGTGTGSGRRTKNGGRRTRKRFVVA